MAQPASISMMRPSLSVGSKAGLPRVVISFPFSPDTFSSGKKFWREEGTGPCLIAFYKPNCLLRAATLMTAIRATGHNVPRQKLEPRQYGLPSRLGRSTKDRMVRAQGCRNIRSQCRYFAVVESRCILPGKLARKYSRRLTSWYPCVFTLHLLCARSSATGALLADCPTVPLRERGTVGHCCGVGSARRVSDLAYFFTVGRDMRRTTGSLRRPVLEVSRCPTP